LNKEISSPYTPEGCSVLVIDDNEVQREALRIQLHNWGMRSIVCGSSKEALRLAAERRKRDEPFDLFVIDSTLDDGSGIDLAPKLYELGGDSKNTHIIMLRSISDDFTGHSLDESRTEFVSKPVLASTLFNAVMERIFAAKKQFDIDSGILSTEIGEKMERQTTAKYAKSVRQPLNAVDRFKSYLTGKVHILAVEDNSINQIVTSNILAEAGFTSDIANDGKEACRAIQNKEYDIILMDCQMPEIDGFEATGLIRQWESEQGKTPIPIIALTANAVKEEIEKCFDSGMDAYCSKPINPLTLIHLIETWYDKTHPSEDSR
jgi:CheY-like chemotaxis protein